MKLVDFTRPGGFPLEQETFAFLQEAYSDHLFTAFKKHLGITNSSNYLLIDATEQIRGWVIIQGRLVPIQPRTTVSSFLEVSETRRALVFGTGIKEKVYISFDAQYVDALPADVDQPVATEDQSITLSYYDLNSFIRVTNIPDLEGKFLRLDGTTPMEADLDLGNNQLSKLDTNETFSAVVRSADFKLGYSTRRGTIYPDRPLGRALVDGGEYLSVNHAQDWDKTRIYGELNLPNVEEAPGAIGNPLIIDNEGNVSKGKINAIGSVPLGTIAIWSNTNAAIPNGWLICDGTESEVNQINVPDLSGNFFADTKYIMYVGDFNPAPNVDLGNDITLQLPTSQVTLTSQITDDPGDTIQAYSWTKRSGGSATIVSPSTANTEITGLTTAGSYVFRLTVSDNEGAKGFDDIRITVIAENNPPVINNITGTTEVFYTSGFGSTILTADVSDPDGDPLTYNWTQSEGPSTTTMSGTNTSQVSISQLRTGVYKFLLKVRDDAGRQTQRTTTVTVTQRATISSSGYTGSTGNRTYTLRVSGQPNTTVDVIGTLNRIDASGSMLFGETSLLNPGTSKTITVTLNNSGYKDITAVITASTTAYNTTVETKGVVGIYDPSQASPSEVRISASYTRSSGGGGPIDIFPTCFDLYSHVLLANGGGKLLKDVQIGDKLLGFDFPNRIDASSGNYLDWVGDSKQAIPAEVIVKDLATFVADSYYEIILEDGSSIKVTSGHPLLGSSETVSHSLRWIKPDALADGMFLLNKSRELLEIVKINLRNESLEVGVLNVETVDNFIISGIVAHNTELSTSLDGELFDVIK